MPYVNIPNFDASRIPNADEPETFHDDAQYIFTHLNNNIIPRMNTNLSDVNLIGNTQLNANTASEGAILATQKANEASASAQTASSRVASIAAFATNSANSATESLYSANNSANSATSSRNSANNSANYASQANTSAILAQTSERNSDFSSRQASQFSDLAILSAQNAAIEANNAKNRTFAFQSDQSNLSVSTFLERLPHLRLKPKRQQEVI
jgi:hypothetical protein